MAAKATKVQLPAILSQDAAPFETLISHLMSSSNEQRLKAGSIFNLIRMIDPNSLAVKLAQLLSSSHHVEVRAMSAILLREQLAWDDSHINPLLTWPAVSTDLYTNPRINSLARRLAQLLSFSHHDQAKYMAFILLWDGSYIWPRLSPATQSTIKSVLLTAIQNENSKSIIKKLCDTISVLASSIPPENEWPEILPFMFQCVTSSDAKLQESAFLIFSQLAQYRGDTLVPYIEHLHPVFLQVLNGPANWDVRIAALSAVINFIQCLNSADRFQDLLPAMMWTLIEALNGAQEATAQEVLKLLIELAGTEPRFFGRQLVGVVGSVLQIAEANFLEEGTRHLAIEFVITLAEVGGRALAMMMNLPQFISSRLFDILMKMLDVKDDSAWHTAEADSEDAEETTNYRVGRECLDRLSIALGGNTNVPVVLEKMLDVEDDPVWPTAEAEREEDAAETSAEAEREDAAETSEDDPVCLIVEAESEDAGEIISNCRVVRELLDREFLDMRSIALRSKSDVRREFWDSQSIALPGMYCVGPNYHVGREFLDRRSCKEFLDRRSNALDGNTIAPLLLEKLPEYSPEYLSVRVGYEKCWAALIAPSLAEEQQLTSDRVFNLLDSKLLKYLPEYLAAPRWLKRAPRWMKRAAALITRSSAEEQQDVIGNQSGFGIQTDECMRPQQATADLTETKLDGNKHIYVCVMPYLRITSSPPWFSVYSISVKSLVPNSFVAADSSPEDFCGSSQHRQVLFLENRNQNGDVLLDRGFICVNGKLYAVGGWMLETSLGQSAFGRTWESKTMCIDFSTLPKVTHSHLKPMNCGKPFPILAEIGDLIFVLPGPPFHFGNLSHPCFEVYDPSKDSWSPLSPPPFLDSSERSSLDIECSGDYKYFVIKDKLYVSTDYVSYAFDMKEERWETCQLFRGFRHPDDFKPVCDRSVWMSLSALCEKENRGDGDAAGDGGPPFAFIRKAILYGEDVLICVLHSWKPLVVAYQIDNGRVVNAQLLCLLEEHSLVDNLLDLGRGFICCQFHKLLYSPVEGPLSLSFMTFWVSKLGGDGAAAEGSVRKFLQFKNVHQSTHEIEVKGYCHPVYSFSL